MPYDWMPRREMPFDRMPIYCTAEISRLGMTLAPKEKPLFLRINGNIDFKFSENPLKAMFEPCNPRKQSD